MLHFSLNPLLYEFSYADGSGHLDYPGHLGDFLSGSKWVLPGRNIMPDSDQKYLGQAKLIHSLSSPSASIFEN